MKTKTQDDAEHALEDESDHLEKQEDKKELKEENRETLAANRNCEQFIDNLEEEDASYWNDPDLLGLLKDGQFQKDLNGICEKLFNEFQLKLPRHFTCDDFKQELIAKFAKTLSEFRGDSKLSTWLYPIARNLLIDITRRHRCVSFESLNLQNEDDEGREGLAAWDRCQTNRNMVAEDEDRKILAHELMRKLSEREYLIACKYWVEKKTTEEIGNELSPKVTRQAVSKQIEKIAKKLVNALAMPSKLEVASQSK